MTWHLSKKNEKVLLQFLPILVKANKDVIIEHPLADRLAYIFRAGANTDYPQLKRFRYQVRGNSLKCILLEPVFSNLTDSLESVTTVEVTDVNDYYAVLQYLSENVIETKTVFKDCILEEDERLRLLRFCVQKGLTPDFEHNQVTITKDA